VNACARRTATGGEREIHVTKRIEIRPIQRCPDLRETVGPTIKDPTVAAVMQAAENAASAGYATAAANIADAALADARAGTATGTAGVKPAATGSAKAGTDERRCEFPLAICLRSRRWSSEMRRHQ